MSGTSDMLLEGPEVVRRQAEWEREIVSLDKKEMELHQTQLKLIRDQTATFIGDLRALRQEVELLKAKQECGHGGAGPDGDAKAQDLEGLTVLERGQTDAMHSTLLGRVAAAERELRASSDELATLRMELRVLPELRLMLVREAEDRKQSHGQLSNLITRQKESLAALHSALQEDRSFLDLHQGGVHGRMDRLEQGVEAQLGELRGACQADLQKLQELAKADRSARETHSSKISELVRSSLEVHDSSMQERLDHVERFLSDWATQQKRELEASRSKVEEVQQQVTACVSQGDGLQSLEKVFRDRADGHTTELKAGQAARSRDFAGPEGTSASSTQQAALAERLSFVEALLGESVEKHADGLSAAHEKLDQLHSRLMACERQVPSIGELRRAQAGVASELMAFGPKHGQLQGRMERLEELLGEAAARHAAELSAIRSRQAQEFREVKAHDARRATIEDRLSRIEQDLGILGGKLDVEPIGPSRAREGGPELKVQASLGGNFRKTVDSALSERVRLLEVAFSRASSACDKDLTGMQHLRDRLAACDQLDTPVSDMGHGCARLTKDGDALAERFENFSRACHEVQERHASELDELRAAHAKHTADLAAVGASSGQHSTLVERLSRAEKLCGEAADRQAERMAATDARYEQQLQGRLLASERSCSQLGETIKALQTGLTDRVVGLETRLGEFAGKQHGGLEAANTKLEQMNGRLAECERLTASLSKVERAHAAVSDREASLDTNHVSLNARITSIDKRLEEFVDGQTGELETLRGAHARHAKTLESLHASGITERLSYMEKLVGDSLEKHAEKLMAAVIKLDKHHIRLSSCERDCSALNELKKSLASMAGDAALLDKRHASLEGRVDEFERAFGGSAEKLTAELESLRAASARLASDTQVRHARLGDVVSREQERLQQVEARLCEAADRQDKLAQGLESLKTGQARLSTEAASREAQRMSLAGRLDRLVEEQGTADAHRTSLGVRINALETSLSVSLGRQGKDLESLQSSHAKQASDLESLRLGVQRLEAAAGSATGEQGVELAAVQGRLGELRGGLAEVRAALQQQQARMGELTVQQEADCAMLRDRLSCLESLVNDIAETHEGHAKDLETAHLRLAEDFQVQVRPALERHAQDLRTLHLQIGCTDVPPLAVQDLGQSAPQ
mmetsp:Transcript_56625/g.160739  ORF Transcript_56625/g.160739 Transcript_56625/m.160739 type:complete len:1158 (-) Transcript_56625:394-3867(-)